MAGPGLNVIVSRMISDFLRHTGCPGPGCTSIAITIDVIVSELYYYLCTVLL